LLTSITSLLLLVINVEEVLADVVEDEDDGSENNVEAEDKCEDGKFAGREDAKVEVVVVEGVNKAG